MIINFILDIIFGIFKIFLLPFNFAFLKIGDLFTYIYSFFIFINSMSEFLDLFIDLRIVYMLLIALLTINNIELIINAVLWILRKIPFLGIK